MYYLWKRSDGHIGASTQMPQTLNCADGKSLTFIKIGESNNWSDLEKLISKEK